MNWVEKHLELLRQSILLLFLLWIWSWYFSKLADLQTFPLDSLTGLQGTDEGSDTMNSTEFSQTEKSWRHYQRN